MRVVTDIHGLERVAPPGLAVRTFSAQIVPNRWKRNVRLLAAAFGSRHLVIHFSLAEIIFFSIFLSLSRCRITTLDFFAADVPRWALPLVCWSLGRVSRFLVYFRDSSIFERTLGIPAKRFQYIPFKVNAYEQVRAARRRDEGYIFSGGRSRRDFATLFAAVETLGYPVKLLTGRESELTPHGSSMHGLPVPANVEILFKDSSMEFFVDVLAGARLVAIPLLSNTRTQAGIGVYLQAMAAGKCLVISSGLGVSDVLLEDQALIVPAGDVAALRDALRRAWEDPDLRARYAAVGARYALSLGGEDQLLQSVVNSLD